MKHIAHRTLSTNILLDAGAVQTTESTVAISPWTYA